MEHYSPLTLVQQDWQRFLTADGLSEKAGCTKSDFRFMLLKELIDNAADAGAASVEVISDHEVVIADEGPGIAADRIADVFNIKRPLSSSKHWRRGQRGALGNGLRAVMGAIHVLEGHLIIHSRGVATTVTIDDNGDTITSKPVPSPTVEGCRIHVCVADIVDGLEAARYACEELAGPVIEGKPHPSWFDAAAVHDLIRSAAGVTVEEFVGQFATTWKPDHPKQMVQDCSHLQLFSMMRAYADIVPRINHIGRNALYGDYERADVTFAAGTANLPAIIECWAGAEAKGKDDEDAMTTLILNRTLALGGISVEVSSRGRIIISDGYRRWPAPASIRDTSTLRTTATFRFTVAISAPYIPIMSSGKRADIEPFLHAIFTVVSAAGKKAQRRITSRRLTGVSMKEAVEQLLPEAYDKVSEGGRYWANVRQLMYAMRPGILKITGKDAVSDKYVTGTLIPDYLNTHEETEGWRVAYDARGNFIEPHTRNNVELGTIAVGHYVDHHHRVQVRNVSESGLLHVPARHRLTGVLFVEKEGFTQLILESGILERHDLALASTKGMSNVASRALIDHLSADVPDFRLYTVTDFDVAGVLIGDTLVNDGWRYTFDNEVRHVPLAVNWEQAQRLHAAGLSEPSGREEAASFADRLSSTGLADEAVDFLTIGGPNAGGLRVEVNALTSAELIEMIEAGIQASVPPVKVIPPVEELHGYWNEMVIRKQLRDMEKRLRERPAEQAPDDLAERIAEVLAANPHTSWDEAVGVIAGEGDDGEEG